MPVRNNATILINFFFCLRFYTIDRLSLKHRPGPDMVSIFSSIVFQWSLHDAMSSPDGSSASSSDDEGDLLSGDLYKMVFVINGELTMGTGKVGAQVGHAAVGLFRVLMSDEFRYGRMLCAWEDSG